MYKVYLAVQYGQVHVTFKDSFFNFILSFTIPSLSDDAYYYRRILLLSNWSRNVFSTLFFVAPELCLSANSRCAFTFVSVELESKKKKSN